MKAQIIETDYIGGQGSLTKEEELALKKYFSNKKTEITRRISKKKKELNTK